MLCCLSPSSMGSSQFRPGRANKHMTTPCHSHWPSTSIQVSLADLSPPPPSCPPLPPLPGFSKSISSKFELVQVVSELDNHAGRISCCHASNHGAVRPWQAGSGPAPGWILSKTPCPYYPWLCHKRPGAVGSRALCQSPAAVSHFSMLPMWMLLVVVGIWDEVETSNAVTPSPFERFSETQRQPMGTRL